MGVTCTLRSATVPQLDALVRRPELLPVFFGADPDEVLPRPTLWQMLLGRKPDVRADLVDDSESMEIDLGKAWHGMHFLFTGRRDSADLPASYLVAGGTPIGKEGARGLHPDQIEAFREFVHSLPEEELRRRYDPKRMTELAIYPRIIWERDGLEALDYILEYHQQLGAFLRDASEAGLGCVILVA